MSEVAQTLKGFGVISAEWPSSAFELRGRGLKASQSIVVNTKARKGPRPDGTYVSVAGPYNDDDRGRINREDQQIFVDIVLRPSVSEEKALEIGCNVARTALNMINKIEE